MITFQHLSSKQKKLLFSSLLLTLAATVVTVLLIEAHFRVPESGTFCNLDSYWNCDKVNKSIFAQIFGIPVSILGFLFYTFFAALLIGLMKGFQFNRYIKPLKLTHLSLATTIFTFLASIAMASYQISFMPKLFWIPAIQNLLAIWVQIYLYRKLLKQPNHYSQFVVWLTQLTFFGVNFALYLSNIEFFILEAICIYCLSQQILITTNFVVLGLLIKENTKQNQKTPHSHDHLSSGSTG